MKNTEGKRYKTNIMCCPRNKLDTNTVVDHNNQTAETTLMEEL